MQALILSATDRAAAARVGRRSALLALLCGSALLVACGGGDSAAPTAAAQLGNAPAPSASTPAVAITGFTPTSVVPGGIVTVTGTALNAVTSVKVGSLDATFRVLSDTSLNVSTVPITATTSRVELGAAGRVVLSAADLTVLLVLVVTSVAPTTVVAPGRVTLSGANLDLVREARLANLALNIATRSATSLVLDVPGSAASGTLSLVDNAGATRTVAQPITVVGPLAISSFAPATILTGQTLTVEGTNRPRHVRRLRQRRDREHRCAHRNDARHGGGARHRGERRHPGPQRRRRRGDGRGRAAGLYGHPRGCKHGVSRGSGRQ